MREKARHGPGLSLFCVWQTVCRSVLLVLLLAGILLVLLIGLLLLLALLALLLAGLLTLLRLLLAIAVVLIVVRHVVVLSRVSSPNQSTRMGALPFRWLHGFRRFHAPRFCIGPV